MSVTVVPYNPWKEQLLGQVGMQFLGNMMKNSSEEDRRRMIGEVFQALSPTEDIRTSSEMRDTIRAQNVPVDFMTNSSFSEPMVGNPSNGTSLENALAAEAFKAIDPSINPSATPQQGGGNGFMTKAMEPGGIFSYPDQKTIALQALTTLDPEAVGAAAPLLGQYLGGVADINRSANDAFNTARYDYAGTKAGDAYSRGDLTLGDAYLTLIGSDGGGYLTERDTQDNYIDMMYDTTAMREAGSTERAKLMNQSGGSPGGGGFDSYAYNEMMDQVSFLENSLVKAEKERYQGTWTPEAEMKYRSEVARPMAVNKIANDWRVPPSIISGIVGNVEASPNEAPKVITTEGGIKYVNDILKKDGGFEKFREWGVVGKDGVANMDALEDFLLSQGVRAKASTIMAMMDVLNSYKPSAGNNLNYGSGNGPINLTD